MLARVLQTLNLISLATVFLFWAAEYILTITVILYGWSYLSVPTNPLSWIVPCTAIVFTRVMGCPYKSSMSWWVLINFHMHTKTPKYSVYSGIKENLQIFTFEKLEAVNGALRQEQTSIITFVSGSTVAPWLTKTSATLTLSSWAARWSGVRPDWVTDRQRDR